MYLNIAQNRFYSLFSHFTLTYEIIMKKIILLVSLFIARSCFITTSVDAMIPNDSFSGPPTIPGSPNTAPSGRASSNEELTNIACEITSLTIASTKTPTPEQQDKALAFKERMSKLITWAKETKKETKIISTIVLFYMVGYACILFPESVPTQLIKTFLIKCFYFFGSLTIMIVAEAFLFLGPNGLDFDGQT